MTFFSDFSDSSDAYAAEVAQLRQELLNLRRENAELKAALLQPSPAEVDSQYAEARWSEVLVQLQADLNRWEQQFRLLVENTPDIVVRVSANFRCLYVNPEMERQTGIPTATFMGKTLGEAGFPCAIAQRWEACFQQVFTTGQPTSLEFEFQGVRGWRSFQSVIFPELGPEGRVESVFTTARDITSLKQTEAALRKSEEQLRKIFDHSPFGIGISAIPDGTMVRTNAAHRQIVGYSPEDLGQITFIDFTHPEDRDRDLELCEQLLAGKIPRFHLEKRYVRKDAQVVWVNVTVSLLHGEDGQPLYMMALIEDISERKRTEALLLQRQQEFRALVDLSPDIVARLDPQLRHLYINRAVEMPLGIPAPSFIGKTPRELGLPEPGVSQIEQAGHQLLATGQPVVAEICLPTAEGDRYYQTRMVPERNAAGEIISMLVVSPDITELKQTEAALRQSEELFRAVFDHSPIGAVLVDVQDYHVVQGNAAYQAMLGYGPEEFPHLTIKQLSHPEDLAADLELVAALLAGAIPLFHLEKRLITRIGQVIWVHLTESLILDQAGQPLYLLGLLQDISDRKQAETALQESEARLRLALEAAEMGVWDVDLKTGHQTWSPASQQLFGFVPGTFDSQSSTFLSRIHPDDRYLMEHSNQEALTTGICRQEFRVLLPDGSIRWLANRGQVFYDEAGKPVRMAGVDMDITQRKQAEEQLQASLEEKSVLLKEIHHRVKNNLQTISSLLKLQAGAIADPQLRHPLRDSQNRVRAMALVHEKLYQSANLSQINFADYVSKLATDLMRSYVVVPGSLQLKIEAEPVELDVDQVVPCGLIVNELVSNAIKHAFPTVWAETVRPASDQLIVLTLSQANHQCHLTVQDNGIGLPSDFDLTQANSLGLQLVQSLTQQLQGTLTVESQRGTTFKVSFAVIR